MANRPRSEPGKAGSDPGTEPVRRRVIFELRLEELPLLQAAERRHGSKRSALVAALAAEDKRGELEQALAQAAERATELERQLERERKRAAEQTAKAARERKQLGQAETRAQRAQAGEQGASKQARSAARERQELERALAEAEDELAALLAEQLTHLFCARCGSWAPEREWAWTQADDGELCYHRACGHHGPGLLDASSRLGWRPLD